MTQDLPPLTALRAFHVAGRLLSFQEAAREMHVTPSAVSHQIRTLEDWLGVTLIDRARRPLQFTPVATENQAAFRSLVARTHAQGRRLRFWGAPDRPWLWSELREGDVDIINTDRIPQLAAFLRGEPPPQPAPTRDEH
jgi:hypothetical protein